MATTVSVSQLQIVKPCHENWNNMTKDEQGAFCKVCSKHVHDFTNDNPAQILAYLQARPTEKVCGRVKSEVLEMPLIQWPVSGKRRWRLATFACAVYLVFGSLFTSCDNPSSYKVDTPAAQQEQRTMGMLRTTQPAEEDNEPRRMYYTAPHVKEDLSAVPMDTPEVTLPDTIYLPETVVNSKANMTRGEITVISGAMSIQRYELIVNELPDTMKVEEEPEATEALVIAEPSLRIYPNPAMNEARLEYETVMDGPLYIELFNLSGQRVMEVVTNDNISRGRQREQLNLSNLASGTYIARMITGSRQLTSKLMVQH